jgi:hypothetical protein
MTRTQTWLVAATLVTLPPAAGGPGWQNFAAAPPGRVSGCQSLEGAHWRRGWSGQGLCARARRRSHGPSIACHSESALIAHVHTLPRPQMLSRLGLPVAGSQVGRHAVALRLTGSLLKRTALAAGTSKVASMDLLQNDILAIVPVVLESGLFMKIDRYMWQCTGVRTGFRRAAN